MEFVSFLVWDFDTYCCCEQFSDTSIVEHVTQSYGEYT